MDDAAAPAGVKARVITLATLGPGGTPHHLPCVFALMDDTPYTSIDAKPKSTRNLQRLHDIARDPRVSDARHRPSIAAT